METDEAAQANPDGTLGYERFIATVLEPALRDLQAQSIVLQATIASCHELIKLIHDHQQSGEISLSVLVDMGERCMMQAVVSKPACITVDTGVMGYIIEMSLDEAKSFVQRRIIVLAAKDKVNDSRAEAVINDLTEARSLLEQLQSLNSR
jgi:prefoldin subunit 5